MFLPILFITTLTIIILTILITILKKKPTKHPPGPKGLPIIGNIHQINPLITPLHLYFTQLSKTYGPILYLKLGFTPLIVISSSKLAKQVLKSKDHLFCGRKPSITQRKLSYNGLDIVFSPPNMYWRELRKICMIHLFSPKQVGTLSSIRREEIKWVLNEITTFLSSSKIVNVNEMTMSTIVSIICRVGFGKIYRDEEKYKRGSEFYFLLKSAQNMFMMSFLSDYFPCMGWMDWFNGSCRRLEKVYKELDEFYEELIQEHVNPNRVKYEQKDIIDVLLELRQQGGLPIELTFDHIKAVLMNIFIAGTETTAGTIVWAMTYLMKNPNTMNKVQVELRAFTKKKGYATFIQEEDIQHLPYLQAIVKETLRIHPVVPLLVPHSSLEKCTLDGYEIEAGTLVFVNAWAIGRDPESWKDPDLFLPERFLNGGVNFKGQDFEFIPFGAGRRICPGLVMGATTVEVVLANLLCWFDWEMPDGMKREDIDMDVLPGISTLKKNALCLYAKNVVKP